MLWFNKILKMEPLKPDDYYINEQGLMVFTAKYLLRRGYCCENNCRHCPYGFSGKEKKRKGKTTG
jgi:hypothetical protein